MAPGPNVTAEATVAANTLAPAPKERTDGVPIRIVPEPVFRRPSVNDALPFGSTPPGESEPATYASEGGGT